MAISTFAELKAAVEDWIHDPALTTKVPNWVVLAEARIRRDVRCRAMETSATGTLSATTVALPTRFGEIRRVLLDNKTLRYLTPEEFQARRDSNTGAYTLIGETLHFQKATGDYQIDYWQWFAPFSGNSDTNYLLTNYPDLYLSAVVAEAKIWQNEDPAQWLARYLTIVDEIRRVEGKFAGPMVQRPEVVE